MTLFERFRGKSLESLPLKERWKLAGSWAAFEIYTPQNLALRLICAVGATPADCLHQLVEQGLDPKHYEIAAIPHPYAH